METIDNIKQANYSLRWIRSDSAPESEMKIFWKELRKFYRTGIKPNAKDGKLYSSALQHLLDDNTSEYPFIIDDKNKNCRSIELEEKAPFYLLDHLFNEQQKENRKSFKAQLTNLIGGLNQLLNIDDKPSKAEVLKGTFDFADELIAFDKMVDLISNKSKEILSESRLKRLKEVISILQEGLNLYSKQEGVLIIEKGLSAKLKNELLFKNVLTIEAEADAFSQTKELFTNQIKSFTLLIKAYRIAKLEIDNEYKEDIHDEYFEHFTWYQLKAEELNAFQPIVLVVQQKNLTDHLASFSNLMASNQPVNVVVLSHELISTPDKNLNWEDASHQFRQEISASAIAHRNVYTFQSGLDNPSAVYDGLADCLRSIYPGICYLSVPQDNSEFNSNISVIAKAENAGRYFPRINYDPSKAEEWGGRFNITDNIQAYEKWPKYILKTKTNEESEVIIDVEFTYADYKAIYPFKAKELMIIPSSYYSEDLVPLSDYLNLSKEILYGKIPYIWLADEDNNLHRAAVPNVWVVSCQERLDFWSFLQELGGIKSYHAQVAVAEKDIEIAKIIDETKSKMEAERQQIIENAQEEAIAKAAQRLISVLMDDEDLQLDSIDSNTSISTTKEEQVVVPNKIESKSEPQVDKSQSSDHMPWVETENCTSCNECTDKYPKLFKYNEEKQAYIDNPSNGTFEELVKAAEKCPAACIHPGMPLNPSEKNLEKLIKRAEKFN